MTGRLSLSSVTARGVSSPPLMPQRVLPDFTPG